MAFTEDLDQFFDRRDFAVEARLFLAGGETRKISIIFSSPSERVALYDTALEAAAPSFQCKSSDIAGARSGNEILIDRTTYTIGRIERGASGTSRVLLKT